MLQQTSNLPPPKWEGGWDVGFLEVQGRHMSSHKSHYRVYGWFWVVFRSHNYFFGWNEKITAREWAETEVWEKRNRSQQAMMII
jgi:hypothetical protein